MSQVSKQFAIYLGLLLVNSTYTLIAPFYPIVAQNKGLPLWLIGVIFALNPLGNIICTPILSKYLQQIGRKRVVIASFILTSLSMFILSPIEYVSPPYVILLSVISRLVGGMGASCLFTTVITIFISEYSDQMQKVIGRMEAAIGLGLIIGPMLGTSLYMINLLAAMTGVGVIILLFVPLGWKMLGEFREYQVKEVNINRMQLFFKPVKDN
jgi:MFS family permease